VYPGSRQLRELVFSVASRKAGEIHGDLLQAQHVEIGERAGGVRDAGRVDPAVDPAAPLDVPADQVHRTDRTMRLEREADSLSPCGRGLG
jgi:hypothetical protein